MDLTNLKIGQKLYSAINGTVEFMGDIDDPEGKDEMVDVNGRAFYAEMDNIKHIDINPWIEKNVLIHTILYGNNSCDDLQLGENYVFYSCNTYHELAACIIEWLAYIAVH